ncbi:MAG: hypothetical protein ACTTKL_02070 [Treponema sp.]
MQSAFTNLFQSAASKFLITYYELRIPNDNFPFPVVSPQSKISLLCTLRYKKSIVVSV